MKKPLVLLLILAILMVVVFGQRWQQRKVVTSAPAGSIAVNPDRVSRLQIQRLGEPLVELQRIGGGWRLRQPIDYAAQDQVVQSVLTSLENLQLRDVVSRNPQKRAKFQVDSTGTHVRVWEGETEVLSVIIGKAANDFSHTYVRRAEEDEVYRAVGMLAYNFTKRVDDWRDKTILNLDSAGISRLQLRYPKEDIEIELIRNDSLWTYSSNGGEAAVADSATVAGLLSATSKLNTSNFATEADTTGMDFEEADFELFIETDSGEHQLRFLKTENGRYLVVLQGSDEVVFSLYAGALSRILKKATDFQGEAS